MELFSTSYFIFVVIHSEYKLILVLFILMYFKMVISKISWNFRWCCFWYEGVEITALDVVFDFYNSSWHWIPNPLGNTECSEALLEKVCSVDFIACQHYMLWQLMLSNYALFVLEHLWVFVLSLNCIVVRHHPKFKLCVRTSEYLERKGCIIQKFLEKCKFRQGFVYSNF
jgi:hypothetical protein